MKRKQNELQSWTNASFGEMASYHWKRITADRRIALLWGVEMILAVMIGASIAIYLDPEWNVVPFPWNVVAFIALTSVAILIHRRTRPFRIARKVKLKREWA